jgi:hypothetical protein
VLCLCLRLWNRPTCFHSSCGNGFSCLPGACLTAVVSSPILCLALYGACTDQGAVFSISQNRIYFVPCKSRSLFVIVATCGSRLRPALWSMSVGFHPFPRVSLAEQGKETNWVGVPLSPLACLFVFAAPALPGVFCRPQPTCASDLLLCFLGISAFH